MIAGGAALNKEVGKFFYAIGFDILEGFGMTEAAPMITFPRPGNVKIGSTGQALPGLTVEIRDGEIVAKGTPEDIARNEKSYTGKYLKKHLKMKK